MKALLCKAHGRPEDLVLEEVAPPTPGRGQVRIAVRASGVNFPDLLMVQGKYQLKPPFPFSPGIEVAGDVVDVGDDVARVAPGDRVMTRVNFGGFAEQVVAPAADLVRMPDGMSYEDGASFLVTYGTSFHALFHRGELRVGEVLLVLGATGGVGLTAVEIGKLMGATVIAAGGSDEKLKVAAEYGADHLINYARESIKDRVKEITGGRGADVIYDAVGGDATDQAMRCVAWNGRLLVVGFAGGRIAQIPANLPLLKGASVVGVLWGAFAEREPARAAQACETLAGLYSAGRLKPYVTQRFPLERGGEALQALANRSVVGKIVLTVP